MDIENQISHLAAENIAQQALLAGLLKSLFAFGGGQVMVAQAFDYADKVIEVAAFNPPDGAPPDYLTVAAKVIEDLRTATYQGHGEP